MARPPKKGWDYFSHDTSFDEDMRAFLAVAGNDGRALKDEFWMTAYGNGTGEVDLQQFSRRKMFADRCLVTVDRLEEVIAFAIDNTIVDKAAWVERKVITSSGVRKRLMFLKKQRKSDRSRKREFSDRKTKGNPPENAQKETKLNQTKELDRAREGGASASRALNANHPSRRVIRASQELRLSEAEQRTKLQTQFKELTGQDLKGTKK